MKENWKELIGKRILLRKKHVTTTSVVEATVVEVSESGKFVKFKWRHGGESWQVPEDEYSFSYDKILEVLEPAKEIKTEEKKEPIYETLQLNECLIIEKKNDMLLVATNRTGRIELEHVKIPIPPVPYTTVKRGEVDK